MVRSKETITPTRMLRTIEMPRTFALRPTMYVGEMGVKGLHHLVYELVANSVDEALAGHAKHIGVRIYADGSFKC